MWTHGVRSLRQFWKKDQGDDHRKNLHKNEVPFVAIEGRVKRLYSLWKKAQETEDRNRTGV